MTQKSSLLEVPLAEISESKGPIAISGPTARCVMHACTTGASYINLLADSLIGQVRSRDSRFRSPFISDVFRFLFPLHSSQIRVGQMRS